MSGASTFGAASWVSSLLCCPPRAATSDPSARRKVPSDLVGDTEEEAAGEASEAASALGGLPVERRWTNSAELVCSNKFEAQLPAARQGVLTLGKAGSGGPLDVCVEGVFAESGQNG